MHYDLTIIGAGPAGFNAALRAKELGLKIALIDKGPIGGTCLNLGCIPTKTLIQSAKVYALAKKSAAFGIENTQPRIDFTKIQERKEKIIQQLRSGMQFMLGGIDFLNAEAKIVSADTVEAGGKTLKTKNILIATGSKPIELDGFKFDAKKILSSDDILNLKEIPKSLLIIGGGVIGCEFASLFSTLGTQVTIAELMPQLLPGEDSEIAKKLEGIFKKKGIKVNIGTDAKAMNLKDYQLVLVCVGRAPNAEKGKIIIDDYLRTDTPNIYAAGDCTGKIMLAHYAAYQGRIAAENIAHPDKPQKADNANIPNCIFTDPEIASVGAKEGKVHKFDFLGSGMARILEETEGFIKIISDPDSKEVIGASIIGPKATELIAILSLAVSNKLTVSQIKETVLPHPTLAESIPEALK